MYSKAALKWDMKEIIFFIEIQHLSDYKFGNLEKFLQILYGKMSCFILSDTPTFKVFFNE